MNGPEAITPPPVLEEDRSYPSRPIVGVGGVVLRGDAVLLVQRGREPLRGAWSLPGGALQVGETLAEGVVREVLEETGLHVTARFMLGTVDRIARDEAGRVRYHYVLVDWLCEVSHNSTHPVAGDDALRAEWVPLREIGRSPYLVGEVVEEMICRATRTRGPEGNVR